MYADDVAILAGDRTDLNKSLKGLEPFNDSIDMLLNIEKTTVSGLKGGVETTQVPMPILFAGKQIGEVKEFQYLGFHITPDLRQDRMYKQLETKIRIQSAKLKRWFIDSKGFAPFLLIRDVIHSLIRGVSAMYLPFLTENQVTRLDIIESTLWRYILKLEWKHPTKSLWYELQLVPPSIQRKSLLYSTNWRLLAYTTDTLVAGALRTDRGFPKSASWTKSVPNDVYRFTTEQNHKTHCKRSIWIKSKTSCEVTNNGVITYTIMI